jgi:hypothetical protein
VKRAEVLEIARKMVTRSGAGLAPTLTRTRVTVPLPGTAAVLGSLRVPALPAIVYQVQVGVPSRVLASVGILAA